MDFECIKDGSNIGDGIIRARLVIPRRKYSSPIAAPVTNGSSQGLCPRIKWELSWIPLLEFHPLHPASASPHIRSITAERLLLFPVTFSRLISNPAGNCVIIRLTKSTLLFTAITYKYIRFLRIRSHCFRRWLRAPLREENRFLESYVDRKMLRVSVHRLYILWMRTKASLN